MRSIDADALKENINKFIGYLDEDMIYRIKVVIDNSPTVELTEEQAIDKLHETGWLPRHDKEMTERPQGEWIPRLHASENDIFICSICKRELGYDPAYCPNCGARMKGGAT